MISSGDNRGVVLALAAAVAMKSDTQIENFRMQLSALSLTPSKALAEIQAVFDQAAILDSYSAVLSTIGQI